MARHSQAESRHSVRLAGRMVDFALRQASRRSVGLKIGQDGLTVTIPHRFPLGELDAILLQKQGWIIAKLDELASRPMPRALVAGSQVDWLGEPRTVAIGFKRASVEADCLQLVAHDADGIPAALEKLMRREARSFLAERLARWAGVLGLEYREFKLSSAGTRWGSCTAGGVIRLNWRLMQAPLPVIDYVVIHELCHLVELNHSDRFWALVGQACPDWRSKRAWLRHEGGRYFSW